METMENYNMVIKIDNAEYSRTKRSFRTDELQSADCANKNYTIFFHDTSLKRESYFLSDAFELHQFIFSFIFNNASWKMILFVLHVCILV